MEANQRKLIAALSLCATVAVPNIASAIGVSGQGTWVTTLQGRDLDGNLATFEAYYDTVLDITWLADANAGAGSIYDSNSGYNDGHMTWDDALAWAASLNFNSIAGWRLPMVSPIDGTVFDLNSSRIGTEDRGFNISAPGTLYAGSTASEMAHLFHNTLGNKGYCDPATATVSSCVEQAGWGLTNTGPFSNIKVDGGRYYTATETGFFSHPSWFDFSFRNGDQNVNGGGEVDYAWAVHAGDVGASVVPTPAAAWLFGSGLIGLLGLTRKKTA